MKVVKNNNQLARIGRRYTPITDVKVMSVMLTSQDISTWKAAINAARSEVNPRRRQLIELYMNIILDGHLTAVVNKRYLSLTNKAIIWKPDEGHESNPEIETDVINATWFYWLRRYAMESIAWGHSLVELIPGGNGKIEKCKLLPRLNVRPEEQYGWFLFNYGQDEPRINFRTDTYYKNYLIEFGQPNDLGLLMQAAQYVIYKRGGFGDWAQFAELFGMPFRVGYYNPYDDTTRQKLTEGLEKMGGAGHAVLPDGSRLEFFQNSGTGASDVFSLMIENCNSEISKIFLGQTMTTEDGSSRSQSQTHKEVEDEIHLADILMMEYALNENLKPKLIELGYPLENGRFSIDNTPVLEAETMLRIMQAVNSKVPLRKSDWYDMFNIIQPNEEDDVVEPVAPMQPEFDNIDSPQPEKKKTVEAHHHYNYRHRINDVIAAMTPEEAEKEFEKLPQHEQQLVERIMQMKANDIPFDDATFRNTISQLSDALAKGLGAGQYEYGHPDNMARNMMDININRFGFDKTVAQMLELNQAFKETKDFREFKKRATGILQQYNVNYLKTEWGTANMVATNARAWNEQIAQQNLYPYLMYRTSGADTVCPICSPLDGKIFNLKESSWRGIYPPNHWNCECEMIQLRSDEANMHSAEIIKNKTSRELLGDEYSKVKKAGFDVNRGDVLSVFKLNDSYLKGLSGKNLPSMNNLDYATLGLDSQATIQKSDLPQLNTDMLTTVEQLKHNFLESAKTIDGKKVKVFSGDYAGRPVGLTFDNFSEHLTGDYLNEYKERQRIFHHVDDILKNPDEVWMTYNKKIATYKYVKFYKNDVMVVVTNVDKNKVNNITTWYKMEGLDTDRKGSLIYKKKTDRAQR